MKNILPNVKKLLTWPWWLTFLLVFTFFFLISIKSLDPDLGWHIKSGEYSMQNGIPTTDIFTYSAPDFPWVNNEPFSDIIVAFLFSLGGHTLLAAIFALIWTASLLLLSKKSKIPGPLILLAAIACSPYAGVRFVTFSMIFLASLITLTTSKKGKYFIPPLMFLWVNLHGSFIIGLAYLAYIAFYNFTFSKKRDYRALRTAIIIIGLSILATLINPYGPRIYGEIFHVLSDSSLRWSIQEWGINITFATLAYLFVFLLALIFTVKKKSLKEFLRPEHCFLLAGLSSQRHWPLFVLASLAITATRFNSFLPDLYKKAHTNRGLRNIILGTLAFIVCFTVYNIYIQFSGSWDRETYRPREAITYLEQHPCQGNLFNEYNDGGYLIQHLPSHKVFIDGRMPSWEQNGTNYMRTWEKIMSDDSFRHEQFQKYHISCALIFSTREDMIKDLQSKNWRIAQKTSTHTLLLGP